MKLPVTCPSCQNKLSVKTLFCENCETQVDGKYKLPMLASLNEDAQNFIKEFVISSGSLKTMAKNMNLSYPSVRNRLDDIIKTLKTDDHEN